MAGAFQDLDLVAVRVFDDEEAGDFDAVLVELPDILRRQAGGFHTVVVEVFNVQRDVAVAAVEIVRFRAARLMVSSSSKSFSGVRSWTSVKSSNPWRWKARRPETSRLDFGFAIISSFWRRQEVAMDGPRGVGYGRVNAERRTG